MPGNPVHIGTVFVSDTKAKSQTLQPNSPQKDSPASSAASKSMCKGLLSPQMSKNSPISSGSKTLVTL